MANDAEKWDLIVEVHNQTKALILYAEEVDPEHTFFWPPLIQQRDALDHIIRAQRIALHPAQISEGKGTADEYVTAQLDKTIGHCYRAFFDVADWFSLIVRERIGSIVSQYSRQTIIAVLPDYSTQIESRVEAICKQIADLRNDKDIGSVGIIEHVEGYVAVVHELVDCLQRLRDARPKLDQTEYA